MTSVALQSYDCQSVKAILLNIRNESHKSTEKWNTSKQSEAPEKTCDMTTSSNGNIFRVTGPLCGEFTGHRWIPRTKGQLRGALMFSLIYTWTNGWVNNRDAGNLKLHRAHYDVTVMVFYEIYCTCHFSFGENTLPRFTQELTQCHWLVCPGQCFVNDFL